LFQTGLKIAARFSDHDRRRIGHQVRVPKEQFLRNLEIIDSIFSDNNVPVVLITAPSAFAQAGVPNYLIEQQLAPNNEFVISEHREYCEIVRQTASRKNTDLLDLDKEFREIEHPEPLNVN
jgi:hypothetical protein